MCAVFVLGQIYFDLKLPDYMSELTVLIKTPGSEMHQIWDTGLSMLGCTLVSGLLCVACGFLAAKVAAGYSYTVREAVFNQVADFGQEEIQKFSVPSLINRTTNDITQIQMLVSMGLQILIKAPVMAVWAIIKIIGKSWTLSAITAGFVVALIAMMLIVLRTVLPRFKIVQRQTDDINRIARENLTGIDVVHAFNAEEYQNDKFEGANEALMRTQLFNQRTFAFLTPAMTLAMNALALVIYWVGAALVNAIPAADMAARLTMFSDIVVFSTYATYVVMSFTMMVMILMFLPAAQVLASRINEVLSTPVHIREGSVSDAPQRGTVEFCDVSFRYPDAAQDALEHISFTAHRGETVAFIGATGSGKTTLVSLIARFYDATGGQVLVDGVDVRDYSFEALYNRIGYVTQTPVLFSDTVRGNVYFGESAAEGTDEDLKAALALAQASEFVEKLPEKEDSRITQGGINVSGGQKQRLSIARALARKPEILIFDDSFSALDYQTDALLRADLAWQLKDTTCLIVAQRIGTIRNADLILVMKDGDIIEQGTHETLLQKDGFYSTLYKSRFAHSA